MRLGRQMGDTRDTSINSCPVMTVSAVLLGKLSELAIVKHAKELSYAIKHLYAKHLSAVHMFTMQHKLPCCV